MEIECGWHFWNLGCFSGKRNGVVVVVDVVVVVFNVDDVADDATPSSLMTSRVFSTTWLFSVFILKNSRLTVTPRLIKTRLDIRLCFMGLG